MIFKRGTKWILKFSDGREEEFFTEEDAEAREKQIQGFKRRKETTPKISQEVKDRCLKKICEKCPSKKDLGLHHKDGNHENDADDNMQTLCGSCHTTRHWEAGKTHSQESHPNDTETLEDWEYLIHHIEIDKSGNEEVHHCFLYDHIANLFEMSHLLIKNGKCFLDGKQIKDGVFHAIIGLEPEQEVIYSDDEAMDNKITPKRMVSGMTLKQKAKEW